MTRFYAIQIDALSTCCVSEYPGEMMPGSIIEPPVYLKGRTARFDCQAILLQPYAPINEMVVISEIPTCLVKSLSLHFFER